MTPIGYDLTHQTAKRKRKKHNHQETHRSSIKCPICLEQHMTITVTTLCGHQFCRRCIYRWLTSHRNCPLCRRKLRGSFSKKTFEPRQPQTVFSQATPPDLS
ncbi:hypothetical protein TNCV_488301 [Trichonephila clavipes]|nr:hypothetical protein TNCV_488301 [Trichonephila clavipes]